MAVEFLTWCSIFVPSWPDVLGEDDAKCIKRHRVVDEKAGIEEVEFVDVVKWKRTANETVDVDPILVVEVFGGAVVWETKVSNNHTYMVVAIVS